tara:strand:- start:163 stop:384 length:222 start_codon:yes stop_codon:yes gene_type:complete
MKEFNVEYNGTIYTIYKDTSESTDVFLQRAWYIINKSDKCNNESFEELVKKSLIWRNYNIYKMKYDHKILSVI